MDYSPPSQAPLSMEFSRHEYWSGLPLPPPGDLPDPRTKTASSVLVGRFFTTEPPGSLRKADLYSIKYWAIAAPNNAFELIRRKKKE